MSDFDSWYDTVKQTVNYKSSKAAWDYQQAKVEKLTAALGSLVALKAHKSIRGKDAHYLRNQPAAWEQARAALKEVES